MKVAFKMKLKKGFEDEYKKRHDEIWPMLKAELKNSGISDYTIFFDEETLILFAVQICNNKEKSDDLPNKEIVKKWWDYMADIMEVNDDNSPITISLKEMFHME